MVRCQRPEGARASQVRGTTAARGAHGGQRHAPLAKLAIGLSRRRDAPSTPGSLPVVRYQARVAAVASGTGLSVYRAGRLQHAVPGC